MGISNQCESVVKTNQILNGAENDNEDENENDPCQVAARPTLTHFCFTQRSQGAPRQFEATP
jgi:hypothetical protein